MTRRRDSFPQPLAFFTNGGIVEGGGVVMCQCTKMLPVGWFLRKAEMRGPCPQCLGDPKNPVPRIRDRTCHHCAEATPHGAAGLRQVAATFHR